MSDIFAETFAKIQATGYLTGPTHAAPDGSTVIVVPEGYKTHALQPLEKPLPRIRQVVTMHEIDSFCAYVNRFKMANTQAFAEPGFLAATGKATIMAVMDYHDTAAPNYGAHMALYMPRYSEQWERWHKVCAAPLKQAEFAEFVEETRADIVEPDAARLMDCVRAFKASKRVEFDSVTYQANGDVTLVYDEKTEQKGASGPLPAYLKLGIPVYFRGERFGVPVFVRFKVGGGAVAFQLKMDRSDVIEDEAFLKLVEKVKTDTGIAVYMGRN